MATIDEAVGSDFATSVKTLTALSAQLLVAQSLNRTVATLTNNTGSTIFVGGALVSNTGPNLGTKWLPGDRLIWQNSQALYGYPLVAGDIHIFDETEGQTS